MSSPATSPIGSTLGALTLGLLGAAILYGITNVQTVRYYNRFQRKDGILLKTVVGVLWALDSMHLAFAMHAFYYYAINNFGNQQLLNTSVWSISAVGYVTNASDEIVRLTFIWRLWRLSNGNWLLISIPTTVSLLTTCLGIFVFDRLYAFGSFSAMSKIAWALDICFSGMVFTDGTVAISLCIYLYRSRTGIRRTDSLIKVLMIYSINTGLLTGMGALITLILYSAMPDNFIYLATYLIVSKLYLNALLATLNSRSILRERSNTDVVSLHVSRNTVTSLRFAQQFTGKSGDASTSAAQTSEDVRFDVTFQI